MELKRWLLQKFNPAAAIIEDDSIYGLQLSAGLVEEEKRGISPFLRVQQLKNSIFLNQIFDQAVVNWLFIGTNYSPAFYVR